MFVYVSPNYVVPAIWIKRCMEAAIVCVALEGIAGSSHFPALQIALSLLLIAPLHQGPVLILRIWLERKITPVSLLRLYIDDIEVPINVFFELIGLLMVH